ncbi:unnamed protein product [Rhodiola kirilowii]
MASTLTLPKLPHLNPRPNPHRRTLPIIKASNFPQNINTHRNHITHLSPQTLKSLTLPLTTLAFPFLLDAKDALAVGGEFGILEGRTLALVHPVDEISELKKQVKPVAVTPDGSAPAPPSPPSPIEAQIQQLSETRKELVKGGYRDKHFNAGSILLGFGVFESVGGGLNTWLRTGKLFPGPHLFAGAGITVLWAVAAALVPAMQKGNETARNLHILLNAANVILFVWQIPTGLDIVFKVFEFTKWP